MPPKGACGKSAPRRDQTGGLRTFEGEAASVTALVIRSAVRGTMRGDDCEQARTKVHRRAIVLDATAYTVLTPRLGTAERFATNRHHGTWHILSDVGGARLLGKLMWAMAFQRHADTILLIDGPLLVENPFDADPSSPIVIVNTDLGS